VAKTLGAFLFERVVPVILELGNAIGEALAPVLPIVEEAFAAWMPVLSQLWGFIESVVVPLLTRYVIPALGKVLEVEATLAKALAGALSNSLSTISRGFDRFMGFIRPVIDALRKVADLAGSVGGKLGSISLPFGIGKSSGAGRSGGVVVNISAGVMGDPVSIGREVSRVLGAYSSRSGHMVTV
jgi:phage-related protein